MFQLFQYYQDLVYHCDTALEQIPMNQIDRFNIAYDIVHIIRLLAWVKGKLYTLKIVQSRIIREVEATARRTLIGRIVMKKVTARFLPTQLVVWLRV